MVPYLSCVWLAFPQILLGFLKKVVDNEENKMNLHNVSMIMAPNLFLVASHRRHKAGTKDGREVKMAAGTSSIIRMLIKYQEVLWTVRSHPLKRCFVRITQYCAFFKLSSCVSVRFH